MLLKVVERAFKFRVRRSKPPHVYHISNTPQPKLKHSAPPGSRGYSDEVELSRAAATVATAAGGSTIFDKIISREVPADIIYEDEVCLAFMDANPQAPVHFLVVPKRRVRMAQELGEEDERLCGHLVVVGAREARLRCPRGFRLVLNNGAEGAQSVYHLHLHVLGGRQMRWPPG